MDLASRRALFHRCDPGEPLPPGDPRYVDLDGPLSPHEGIRGGSVAGALATRIELTNAPEVLFFSGPPGGGKSTELLRVAARLGDPSQANALVVVADAQQWLDLGSTVDTAEVLLGLLLETEHRVLLEEGADTHTTVHHHLLLPWLVDTDAAGRLNYLEIPDIRSTLRDVLTSPDDRKSIRHRLAGSFADFVGRVRSGFASLHDRAVKCGRAKIVLVLDSFEKLRDPDATQDEVLRSAERVLLDPRLRDVLPGPAVLTVPPALTLRHPFDPLYSLPALRVRGKDGSPDRKGLDACRAMVLSRASREELMALFGQEHLESGLDKLIDSSGGSPRDLMRLLREVIAAAPADHPLSSAGLERALERWMESVRSTVQDSDLDWLRRVSIEKRIAARDPSERALAGRMLANGLVLPHQNGTSWTTVHPAVAGLLRDRETRATAADPQAPPPSPRAPEAHAITHVALTNIGPFHDLSLDLSPGWNVLLGDNGCGKTSVLRAVGLALAGTDPRAAVASERQLRAGEATGAITVTTDRGKYSTSLTRLPAEVRTTAPADTLTQQGRWLTLGFPAVRGLSSRAISGPTTVAPPVPGAHDLLPLLEGAADSRLDDTRQWIVNTALRADSHEPEDVRERHRRLLTRWFSILRELMPGLDFEYERVDRESWQVLVRTADGTIPIEQLSQGMVSTIGWIGTLLRRLYEAFPRSAEPEREPALVLVDEIDAHLHPTWQQRIVPLVRAQFPRLQVIATSHSSLVASNLEAGELLVFRRDEGGRITASQVEEPLRGYRADQVLTSGAFGLETTRSEYATKLLSEYTDALSQENRSPEANARVAELSVRVRREIASPPETIEERRALDEAMREADDMILEVVFR